ncbi:MAG: translation initiation factor IF-2 [Candidatus Omnitrophica bacterium]|nr:translation initiation factor IF-2 [Candidatus Omnitrophota bacterium]
MRIYEYARLMKVSTKEILELCRQLGWKNKKSVSSLNEDECSALNKRLQPTENKPRQQPARPPKEPEPQKDKTNQPGLSSTKFESQPAPPINSAVSSPEFRSVTIEKPKKKIQISGNETVAELAAKIGAKPGFLLAKFIQANLMVNVNQRPGIESIKQVLDSLGMEIETQATAQPSAPQLLSVELKPRAPVVTIMGHVDHGKTTILDSIRKSRLAQKEFGQITQKIGAYRVELPAGAIVFLDTPGHEAFTAMRARGATATDLVVLVVAADEGVKPQTVEAINHARSAKVPIIVAVNKIDRPNANPDRVRQQLAEHGLVPDSWGGETVFVNVSAVTGEGMKDLLDMILLVAEMLELKANPDKPGEGVVIESRVDRTRGPVLSVLVQDGTIRVGDSLVAGGAYGRIRALFDDWNRRISEAGPSTPVEVLGSSEIAPPGTKFQVVANDKLDREIAEKNRLVATIQPTQSRRLTLEDLYQQTKEGKAKELKLILKADCLGSVEAIRSMLEKQKNDNVSLSFIHSGTGPITENDILLAAASNGVVIGFNVSYGEKSEEIAKKQKVEVKIYRLIYDLLDDIKRAMEGLLEPEILEVLSGQALVKKVFTLSNNKVVAGCLVVDGKMIAGSKAKVIHDGKVIHEGTLSSLKRFKDSVKEVAANTECGIEIADFKGFTVGDIIQSVLVEKISRSV